MNMNAYLKLLKLPPLLMALLLQLVPLCRTALLNPGTLQSSFSIIFKWVATAGMTLGAVDAVSGASVAISGLKPYEGTTQTGPVSFTPTVNGDADNVSLRIQLNQLTQNYQLDYYNCSPLPPGFTIDTNVGAGGFITAISGQTRTPGVYPVTLMAGNQLGDVQGYPPVTAEATITVTGTVSGSPPTITSPPTSITVDSGSTTSLTVVANDNGTAPLSYQWRKAGNNVGTDSPTLAFNPVTLGDAGSYDVIVSNSAGSITSSPPAVLTVVETVAPPAIETGPVSQTAYVGGVAEFSVTASSSARLTYQWRKGGANIGTDSATLSISPVTVDSAGDYDVIVSNSGGSVTSTPVARLTVVQPDAMQLEIPTGQSTGGPRVVSWQGIAGKSYLLQRRDNFSPDVWHDLGVTNVTTGGIVEMIDETAGTSNVRFYRVGTD